MTEVVFNGLEDRIHFYFCLLVALRLMRKQGRLSSHRQKNAFIMKWLKNAGRVASFHPCASSEIVWLRSEILRHPPDRDLEPVLMLIYQTASEMRTT
ncbi:hypothetical protein [Erwinia psidii]|uniref:DUF2913 family protein n=1 Tax=Erwinia psidii TaxID=69224 RepID=A0A3N6SCK9_9GAMM|nr:hypothetical protein [Erwinia psidii]MCX8955848.1 hypothetical protein [Erwinia psidii]MCX8961596.1 hypothetical protein [Erwinia psidii]MCX8965695.1 hypothetical protein [Erwinia psidii]RQM37683.1 hypothetical protein EB241_14260 [Erwinia psidii]